MPAFLFFAAHCAADFATSASGVSNLQLQMDQKALLVEYNTDFQKKVNPGLYTSRASGDILELFNSAEYALSNVKQTNAFVVASYLCFTEPSTDGCEHFNDLGCSAVDADCGGFGDAQKSSMASMCSRTTEGKKEILNGCFIVSLRRTANGASRDSISPWNEEMQAWVGAHNCTSLMYHLTYRCFANLIKWNDVTAEEEYVDLDKLFDAAFGIAAVSHFNGQDPLDCGALTDNDRSTLMDTAKLHVEAAVISFMAAASSLARFGLSAADSIYRQYYRPTQNAQDKLRATLLINVFYDGAVQPFREWCCASSLCYDYHPMDVFVDKVKAFNTFYPGGLVGVSSHTSEFAGMASTKVHPATNLGITAADGYVFSVLKNAPMRTTWEAAAGVDVTNFESF